MPIDWCNVILSLRSSTVCFFESLIEMKRCDIYESKMASSRNEPSIAWIPCIACIYATKRIRSTNKFSNNNIYFIWHNLSAINFMANMPPIFFGLILQSLMAHSQMAFTPQIPQLISFIINFCKFICCHSYFLVFVCRKNYMNLRYIIRWLPPCHRQF